jgi:hypothetical protein
MGTMTNERFAQLVATGKLITDYADSGDVVDMEALDEDMGVAMKFENEDEDEADSDADEVKVHALAQPLPPSAPSSCTSVVCRVRLSAFHRRQNSFLSASRTSKRKKRTIGVAREHLLEQTGNPCELYFFNPLFSGAKG